MYDLIIVGLGPAGVCAAIYAKRSGLKVLCLEKNMPGGIINYIDRIDNYPGMYGISGADFSYKLYEHLNSLEIEYKLDGVLSIEKKNDFFEIKGEKKDYKTKKIIIASGRKAKKLGLVNEEKFLGRGLSYCAVCDGAFFKNQTIAVVGSGRSAVQETMYLAKFAYKIYMIVRKDSLHVEKELENKLKLYKNVEIIYNTKVTKLNGNEKLESVILNDREELRVTGLFIYIGYEPNISYLKDFDIFDNNGYIIVDKNYETKVNGLYAVGDSIKREYYQIIMAMASGAEAALNVAASLKN